MFIRLKEEDLQQDNLSWVCIEPMLLSVRGKNLDEKSAVYNQLNEGQKALYLFYAYSNHVHTISEFYWFSTYFISELKAWNGLKSGVRFFKGHELLNILEHTERVIENKNKVAEGIWKDASPSDLETDNELLESIKPLFNAYQGLVQELIREMNSYIRNNKEEFLEIES
ncbi:hypothetical protein [Cohnella sp. WQ 127256]|uniref:hypothetical protein n=1 Tax=Cohnella sp. WQ 127256 TaxID=2938790 RepID=UPI002118EF27|nr:hypothetical protein [Cohnella sp. WQ 127256]